MIYASLGDTDQALNWLEKGYEERFNPGVLLRPRESYTIPFLTPVAGQEFTVKADTPGKY